MSAIKVSNFVIILMLKLFCCFQRDLQMLQERQQKKCERLEMMCREEENSHWQQISEFQDRNKVQGNNVFF
jgi:hypothetical protein